MRVYELAKELGTDSKTVIQILKENESIGTVKNHMSSVDEDQKGVARLGLKLDETSFDEYVDDDIKEKLHRIEPNLYVDDDIVNDDGDFGFVKGTAGTTEDKEVEKQEVIVERPTGFWGWLKGLF
jgi:hypothetical protein